MFSGKKNTKIQPVTSQKSPGISRIEKGTISLTDILAPSSVEVDFNFIRVGGLFYKTLFVVGYPRFVSPNWLAPLIDFDHSMNISMFCYPTASNDVLSDLRRKVAEMEATISSQVEEGKVVDPKVQAALEDALGLQEQLAKGVERFFQFSLYITLFSESVEDLEESAKKLSSALSSLLMITKTATLQMEEGFKSSIPGGVDELFITRNMDTTSLASTFPFTSAMLTQDKGIMYGINEQNGSLIVFDRYSLENANEVVFGKSGSGKSYLIKLEALRQFMFGTEVIIIDPEGEYETLANTLGGEHVSFTPSDPVKINPFDLSGMYEEGENELGLKILSLHGLLKIVMGQLDAAEDAILDRALVETYRQKGITVDPSTQKNQPPLMEDLYKVLIGMEDPAARNLALRLEKFIKGSLSGIFNQQSNFDIKNPFTVFSIKALEEELRPIAMHIILDFVWTRVRKSLKKRLLILDEAWYIMKYEDSASFVYGIAKRARKYYLALTTATQDVEDFLSTDYGKAVLSNSSIQMLLKQSPSEIDLVTKVFYLSEGEKELLLSADVGEGLFFAGQSHVVMKIIAAPFEHAVITSNPQELMKQEENSPIEGPPISAGQSVQETEPTPATPQAHPQPTQPQPVDPMDNIISPSQTPQPSPGYQSSPTQPSPVNPPVTTPTQDRT
ncbi:MAG: ATP-binding protein [Candidatus Levybacteria bacterium]|nr:ATP-binding protein [Candidatus Levybacteria bacterium]